MKKTFVFAALAAALLTAVGCGTFAPENAEDSVADEKAIAASVKKMDLTIEINQIIPASMEDVTSNGTYLLKFNDGKINGTLPFFGECYKIAHGGDVELIFEDADYKVINRKHSKKSGSYDIKLQAKSRSSEKFDIYLSITESGYANVSFSTSGRSRISYYGSLRLGGETD